MYIYIYLIIFNSTCLVFYEKDCQTPLSKVNIYYIPWYNGSPFRRELFLSGEHVHVIFTLISRGKS